VRGQDLDDALQLALLGGRQMVESVRIGSDPKH
jgi:hypothetical protein